MNSIRILAILLLSVAANASVYMAPLTGLDEVPPNGSPANGFVVVTIAGDSLTVDLTWTGLVGGPASAAHLHCCTPPGANAGVAIGFAGFPLSTAGSYLATFDLLSSATYGAGFLAANGGTAAGAQAALIAGLDAGQAYANIHNSDFAGGEIRADLELVPEPSTLSFLVAGMLLLVLARAKLGRLQPKPVPRVTSR